MMTRQTEAWLFHLKIQHAVLARTLLILMSRLKQEYFIP